MVLTVFRERHQPANKDRTSLSLKLHSSWHSSTPCRRSIYLCRTCNRSAIEKNVLKNPKRFSAAFDFTASTHHWSFRWRNTQALRQYSGVIARARTVPEKFAIRESFERAEPCGFAYLNQYKLVGKIWQVRIGTLQLMTNYIQLI